MPPAPTASTILAGRSGADVTQYKPYFLPTKWNLGRTPYAEGVFGATSIYPCHSIANRRQALPMALTAGEKMANVSPEAVASNRKDYHPADKDQKHQDQQPSLKRVHGQPLIHRTFRPDTLILNTFPVGVA